MSDKTPSYIQTRPLEHYLINETGVIHLPQILQNNLKKVDDYDNYIITQFGFYSALKDLCPTITTNCRYYYSKRYNRYLSTDELLLLQGFNPGFKQVVSKSQLCKQIGNSMSVNVVKEIINEALKCVT